MTQENTVTHKLVRKPILFMSLLEYWWMLGEGQRRTLNDSTKGKIAQQTNKHRDVALALRCLYSKRLDTRLVDITAMQVVAAEK